MSVKSKKHFNLKTGLIKSFAIIKASLPSAFYRGFSSVLSCCIGLWVVVNGDGLTDELASYNHKATDNFAGGWTASMAIQV